MTRAKKDVPQVWEYQGGDWRYRVARDMTFDELAKRDADQKALEDMLARQEAYMNERLARIREKEPVVMRGCVFAKSCELPVAIIDYQNPTGYIPTEMLSAYGAFTLLGGREVDESGCVPLKTISGAFPASIGTLALGGTALASLGAGAAVTAPVAAGALVGLVGLLMPSNLADGSLYTEEQLRSLEQARTRVRLHVEPQVDGTVKGYGYNTQSRRDWEMIPVVTFQTRGEQQVADFGDGVELIWTPAVDPASTLGIPALEAAPQAPRIWIFPPTPMADSIIVNPIYPPEFKDFILVFPVGSGVSPLYIVYGLSDHKYHPTPKGVLPAFPDLVRGRAKTPVQGGGGLRPRWHDRKGNIYEWDRQHGALEKYNPRGKHLGEFNHITGEQTKKAIKTREVEP
ncbi:S-type pyocin domain-containing protein [Pseudomonas sp. SWRI92]|uniref:colicin E3/pyocin S6 family cytotoxin n=1 Tax=Pseudomonas sp. SWRI92 TaxID=2745499 RepID=UPI0016481E47|nr:colicin E3/pyocin S6 family cytotoxin [Pseudomonas sp. SWRI92]MBC3375636.1 S-type pyocin domain-containing protein [Pseudomonas sp. SWRI92]